MAVVADLHVHTTNSDGSLAVADVPAAARRASLDAVAVTDHDRIHPALDAPVSMVDGVTLIHGIELRVAADDQRVDLLGYGVEPTPPLEAEIERLQHDRIERGAAMIERVETELGVDLGVEARAGLGRPHIARAIADHPDAPFDVQGAFDHLIGDGRPCYVPRAVPDFDRGRRLLAGACSLVGLAHPLRYEDPSAALDLASRLDTIERWYPYDRPVDPDVDDGGGGDGGVDHDGENDPGAGVGAIPGGLEAVDRAIAEYDLLPTGGSDAHDDRLGRAGLARAAYERVRARLPDPA